MCNQSTSQTEQDGLLPMRSASSCESFREFRVDLHGIPVDKNGYYFEDYYRWYASRDKIPNVCLADYRRNCGAWAASNFLWMLLCLLIAFGNRFSTPRMDHLFSLPYLRNHWRFHFFQWFLYLLVFVVPFVLRKYSNCLQPATGNLLFWLVPLLAAGHVMYFGVAWGILKFNTRWRSLFKSRAAALQVWEFVLWIGWLTMVLAVNLILALDSERFEFLHKSVSDDSTVAEFRERALRHPAVVSAGIVLLVVGFVAKIHAQFLSGVNNYYYYDFILQTPNERFVDSGLYRWCGSPTYVLGYLDGFGCFLLAGAAGNGSFSIGLVWMVCQLQECFRILTNGLKLFRQLNACLNTYFRYANILLNNVLIEQPGVRRMYFAASESDVVRNDRV